MKKRPSKASATEKGIVPTAENRLAATRDFFSPGFQATLTESLTCEKSMTDEISLSALRAEIDRACDDVNAGNMGLPERMALAQAHTLDHLFHRLTRNAFANSGKPWFETCLRLALRAQAQSARTLETLAALKHPTIFAKQMNVANQQVVTNGRASVEATPSIPASLPERNPIVRLANSEILTRAHERVER